MATRRVDALRAVRWALLWSVGGVWGCGGGDGPTDPDPDPGSTPDPPRPVAISISPPSATLGSLLETATFAAEVTDQNGRPVAGAAATWSSDAPAAFSVDGDGVVTPVANGSGTLRATYLDLSATATVTVDAPLEEVALVALYNAAGGPDWTESGMWLTGASRGEWHGVVTDDEGRVVELRLPGNGLAGTIPPEIGGLASLKVLDLAANALTGPVPPELGELASLERLYLHENELSGPLPAEIGKLANLVFLDLFSNALSGPVPPELGGLAALEYLYLTENGLTGLLPSELGGLGSLRILDISANALRGPLPPDIARIERLESISLEDNAQMSGELPADLTALRLDGLFLGGTDLCAPRDDDFQAWLRTILFRDVKDC